MSVYDKIPTQGADPANGKQVSKPRSRAPGGGDPGADPVGQAHQGPAPHRVHPGLRVVGVVFNF